MVTRHTRHKDLFQCYRSQPNHEAYSSIHRQHSLANEYTDHIDFFETTFSHSNNFY